MPQITFKFPEVCKTISKEELILSDVTLCSVSAGDSVLTQLEGTLESQKWQKALVRVRIKAARSQ